MASVECLDRLHLIGVGHRETELRVVDFDLRIVEIDLNWSRYSHALDLHHSLRPYHLPDDIDV